MEAQRQRLGGRSLDDSVLPSQNNVSFRCCSIGFFGEILKFQNLHTQQTTMINNVSFDLFMFFCTFQIVMGFLQPEKKHNTHRRQEPQPGVPGLLGIPGVPEVIAPSAPGIFGMLGEAFGVSHESWRLENPSDWIFLFEGMDLFVWKGNPLDGFPSTDIFKVELVYEIII